MLSNSKSLSVVFLFALIFGIGSCKSNKRINEETGEPLSLAEMIEYEAEMLESEWYRQVDSFTFVQCFPLALIGDTAAYVDLSKCCYYDSRQNDVKMLVCAMNMYKRHHYSEACFDVFYIISSLYEEIAPMDSFAIRLSLKYLEMGANDNNKDCLDLLSYLYLGGNKVLPWDTIKGREYLIKYENGDTVKADSVIDCVYREYWTEEYKAIREVPKMYSDNPWSKKFLELTMRLLLQIDEKW